MPRNNIDKIASTFLFFAIVFSASIIYFVIVGEIKIGTGSGVPTYDLVSYEHSPVKFISILAGLGLVVAGLFVARWFALKHKN